MNVVWHLTALIGCALLLCPPTWLLRPALLLRQALWTTVIIAGHHLGRPLKLLALSISVGLSLPLLFSALTPFVSPHASLPDLWILLWMLAVIALRLIFIPALLIEWSTIRPWEQEIARRGSLLVNQHEHLWWKRLGPELRQSLARTWRIALPIANPRNNAVQEQWRPVARCSGLFLLHLCLLIGSAPRFALSGMNEKPAMYLFFLIVIVIYVATQSIASARHYMWKLTQLALIALTVYFSYSLDWSYGPQKNSGISAFLIISLLFSAVGIHQTGSFLVRVRATHTHTATFGSGQWQFNLINQFAKLGKIAVNRSNIFIFLNLLDAAAAILRITVT